MTKEYRLALEAHELVLRLNNTAFRILALYARLPYTDPRMVRLNRLIGKANERQWRRFQRYEQTIRPTEA